MADEQFRTARRNQNSRQMLSRTRYYHAADSISGGREVVVIAAGPWHMVIVALTGSRVFGAKRIPSSPERFKKYCERFFREGYTKLNVGQAVWARMKPSKGPARELTATFDASVDRLREAIHSTLKCVVDLFDGKHGI